MKFSRRWLAALVLLTVVPALSGHDDGDKTRALMRKKLEHAQKVLEGVALGDFKMIARHGEELIFVSKEAEWKVVKSPRYDLLGEEFRDKADTLVQKAKEKNLDGATLAYVELTMSCVKCHKYVREVRMTRLDDPRFIP